jgi:hypothetical protein
MFLMTSGAGFVLHQVRFMKRVLLMTRLAFAIDRIERNAVVKAFA